MSYKDVVTGAAWLSSARGVSRSLKWGNERNPYCQLQVSGETAHVQWEEGGDDVKSAWPLYPGRHTRYNGADNALRSRKAELIASNDAPVRIEGCNSPS